MVEDVDFFIISFPNRLTLLPGREMEWEGIFFLLSMFRSLNCRHLLSPAFSFDIKDISCGFRTVS